jgi:hypothetical protein
VTVLGGLGFVYLIIGRTRRWWVLPSVRVRPHRGRDAATLALVVAVLGLFPDVLPIRVLIWAAVAAAAASLVAGRWRSEWGRRARACRVAGGGHFAGEGQSPLRLSTDLCGGAGAPTGEPDRPRRPPAHPMAHSGPSQALARHLAQPARQAIAGGIAPGSIPGLRSHFPARMAWLYLPPAYLSSHAPGCRCWYWLPGRATAGVTCPSSRCRAALMVDRDRGARPHPAVDLRPDRPARSGPSAHPRHQLVTRSPSGRTAWACIAHRSVNQTRHPSPATRQ